MLSNKSIIVHNKWRPAPSLLILALVFFYALISSGCAGLNPLTDYDFSGRTLAVEAPVAPAPRIITNSDHDILGVFKGSPEAIFTATTAVVKETRVAKARQRMKDAADKTDVAWLVAEGIMNRSERYLRFPPAPADELPDLLLLVRINDHGIFSGPAYDGRTEFFLDAYVELVDDYTGDSLWKKQLSISEPISDHFFFSNLRSSNELSNMSESEMRDALERISDYTAETVVQVLRREIARAKR